MFTIKAYKPYSNSHYLSFRRWTLDSARNVLMAALACMEKGETVALYRGGLLLECHVGKPETAKATRVSLRWAEAR